MKESLTPENRKDIVKYRLERAEDSIKEAKFTYDAATVTMYMPLVENFVQSIRNRINELDPEYFMH